MNNIRRLDDLGRVVIPKEIRRVLEISQGDALKVSVNSKTGQIIIEKYNISGIICNWCGKYVDGKYEKGADEGVFYHPDCYKKAIIFNEHYKYYTK